MKDWKWQLLNPSKKRDMCSKPSGMINKQTSSDIIDYSSSPWTTPLKCMIRKCQEFSLRGSNAHLLNCPNCSLDLKPPFSVELFSSKNMGISPLLRNNPPRENAPSLWSNQTHIQMLVKLSMQFSNKAFK